MTPAGNRDGREAAEFLNDFCEFLGDTDDQTPEEIRAELIAEGIDVDKMVTTAQSMVKAKISESKRAWLKNAPAQRLTMLEKLNSITQGIPLTISEIREKVEGIAGSGENREIAFAFRNFDQLSDDDLIKLYSDYVKLLSLKKDIDEKKS